MKEPDVQVFTLKRWMWYRRSGTQQDFPLLNKPQDAVRSNSHAAPCFHHCLCVRPHILLSVCQQQELPPAGSWSGHGGPAGWR